ncbi:T9SS type A sorting domain-containing protein [Spirosoma montaniterrae]|uniref:FlgD/Vpr Ig-like domain-containing protein n=1 Tax=Spirosoma montaniterrae TaxID=1178516 RepID=A0A1P9WRN3_9BACT|nr:T9SS type A sorting domain-containing protein [Spirosoma montaniterrae]AQG78028.1 hypothetical protein AWR27_00880 [Spirosoma montaniterrae]
MNPIKLLLFILLCPVGVPVLAQKMVPHSFRYQADTSDRATTGRDQLRFLTRVTQPNTTFLRLYFAGTQLGEGSYLVLDGTDGTRQELRKQDLENWRYSSAYFNGQSVNVSLFTAPGDQNMVSISGMKVSDELARLASNDRQPAQTQPGARQAVSTPASLTETYSHAKAVGRFTDGVEAAGTGWIAPNGAIVTLSGGYDVIEFNVPPSVGTTVQHPAPQDQYPVNYGNTAEGTHKFVFKGEGWISKVSWKVVEALPNNITGLRPGERQQEYFRIAKNPSNYILDKLKDASVDLFHYGTYNGPVLEGNLNFKNLQLTQTSLQKQNNSLDYDLPYASDDRDLFVVYSTNYLAYGAPIAYEGSNVAIGVHDRSNEGKNPAVGPGFQSDSFRNGLARFFSDKSAYVDLEGLYDQPTGEIHRPYLTVQQAAQHTPDDYTVYIAKGTYPGAVTFNQPLTLRAPVGKVVIGSANGRGRRAAESSVARNVAMAESMGNQSRLENPEMIARVRAYPNPFREQTEIKYPFAEGGPVSVNILNTAGVSVATFNLSNVATDSNGVQWNGTDQRGMPVPAGLYIINVNNGRQTFTTKVLKQ